MEKDDFLNKILKVIGVAALIAIPIFFIFKKYQSQNESYTSYEDDDDSNIFSEELQA